MEPSNVTATWLVFQTRPNASQTAKLTVFYAERFRALFATKSPDEWRAELLRVWNTMPDDTFIDTSVLFTEAYHTQLAKDLILSWSTNPPPTTGDIVIVDEIPFSKLSLSPLTPLVLRIQIAPKNVNLILQQVHATAQTEASDLEPFTLDEASLPVYELRQADFQAGTVYLRAPGKYLVMENIVFNPEEVAWNAERGVRPAELGPVLPSTRTHADPSVAMGQALGAFAAIVIAGSSIVLDLQGHRIDQSEEHALQQRFYATIELASAPFVPAQGPFDASTTPNFTPASHCIVRNGTLGRSSHHSIHGNVPSYVLMEGLVCENYEVAAIAINGGKHIWIRDCHLRGQRGALTPSTERVPVAGTYSNARYLVDFARGLPSYEALATAIDIAFFGILQREDWYVWDYDGPSVQLPTGQTVTREQIREAARLFDNPSGLIDGSAYGILSNSRGVAVGGFPDTLPVDAAMHVVIQRVTIANVVGNVVETPALRYQNKAAIDPIGAVLQTRLRARDGTFLACAWNDDAPLVLTRYIGNALLNAQVDVVRNKAAYGARGRRAWADPSFLAWATQESVEPWTASYYVNCDVMMHTVKGVIGLKLDATMGVHVERVSVTRVENVGPLGSDVEGDYTNPTVANAAGVPYEGYQGGDSRGVSVAGSCDVVLRDVEIRDVLSACADVFGVDVLKHTRRVHLKDCIMSGVYRGGQGRRVLDYTCSWDRTINGAVTIPRAMGVHADASVMYGRCEGVSADVGVSWVALGQRGLLALDGGGWEVRA